MKILAFALKLWVALSALIRTCFHVAVATPKPYFIVVTLLKRGPTLESDVCRRQILTSKIDPRYGEVKNIRHL